VPGQPAGDVGHSFAGLQHFAPRDTNDLRIPIVGRMRGNPRRAHGQVVVIHEENDLFGCFAPPTISGASWSKGLSANHSQLRMLCGKGLKLFFERLCLGAGLLDDDDFEIFIVLSQDGFEKFE